jgi:hypothetical protein
MKNEQPSINPRPCLLLCTHNLLVDVQAQPAARSAEGLVVSGAGERTLRVRNILRRRRTAVSSPVQRVATEALFTILDARVVVLPALLCAELVGHDLVVGENQTGEEAAGTRLLDARVVGKVAVALPDDRARGARLSGRGAGLG